MKSSQWIKVAVIASSMMCASLNGQAAEDHGKNEVAGIVGVAEGDATYGGAFTRSLTEKISLYGEFSRINGGSASVPTTAGTFSGKSSLQNFNAGIQYNFTGVMGPKFVPYVGVGLGMLRSSVKYTLAGQSTTYSDSAAAFNVGAGLRYYVGRNWGLRPELMYFARSGSYSRFTVGIFWAF
jgi:hypothetical protein